MLKSMRSAFSSWIMKLILAVTALSMIGFLGFQGGEQSDLAGAVATVNGEAISNAEFSREYERRIQAYRYFGLLKDNPSEQVLGMMRERILTDLVNRKIKVEEAERLGLRTSKNEIRKTIEKQFSDKEGNFDVDLYKKIIRYQERSTPAKYEKSQGNVLLAQRLDHLIQKTAHISEWELKENYKNKNEMIDLHFVKLNQENLKGKIKEKSSFSQEEIQKHFDTNKEGYRRPEQRDIEVAWLDLMSFANPNESDLQGLLEKEFPGPDNKQAMGERFRASHILVKTKKGEEEKAKKKAEEIYGRVAAGADFASLAAQESEDSTRGSGGDLGYFGLGVMVKEFEDATKALKPGKISKPVQSKFGYHVIRLEDHIPAGPVTLDRLRNELTYRWRKAQLQNPQKTREYFDIASTQLKGLLEKLDKNDSFKSLTEKNPEVQFATTGLISKEQDVPHFDDDSLIRRRAWQVALQDHTEPFQGLLTKKAYVARVAKVQPGKMPSLAEVRKKVENDLRAEERKKAVKEYAEKLIASLQNSKAKDLKVMAKSRGLTVVETGSFRRSSFGQVPKIGKSELVMKKGFQLTLENPVLNEPAVIGDNTYVFALKEKKDVDWKKFDEDTSSIRNTAADEIGRARVDTWTESFREKSKIEQANLGGSPISPSS